MPTPNDGPAIQDLVIADMAARKQVGIQRYGTPLQAHNGRDWLRDAYEEALDLTVYLRQGIEERDGTVGSATQGHTAATEPELCAEPHEDLDGDASGLTEPGEGDEPVEDRRTLSWDWREGPDLDELTEILADLGVTVRQIDAGGDWYEVEFSRTPAEGEDTKAAAASPGATGSTLGTTTPTPQSSYDANVINAISSHLAAQRSTDPEPAQEGEDR